MKNILIIGAGGHGRVVYETVLLKGNFNEIAFLDDSFTKEKKQELNIIGKIDDYKTLASKYDSAFVAIGNNEKRIELIKDLLEIGYDVPVLIHPRATVSSFSKIGKGTIVLAGAIINVNCKIGRGNIININSTIDHDCILEEGCHICSGAVVRSMVTLESLALVGAGAVIKSGQRLEHKRIILDGERVV